MHIWLFSLFLSFFLSFEEEEEAWARNLGAKNSWQNRHCSWKRPPREDLTAVLICYLLYRNFDRRVLFWFWWVCCCHCCCCCSFCAVVNEKTNNWLLWVNIINWFMFTMYKNIDVQQCHVIDFWFNESMSQNKWINSVAVFLFFNHGD